MTRLSIGVIICTAFGLLATGRIALAADTFILERPPGEGPTKVSASFFVVDVFEINDVNQTIRADVVYRLKWKDDRLAMEGIGRRRLLLDNVWHPEVTVGNPQQFMKELKPRIVSVDADGKVEYTQRYVGTFSITLDLSDFPFDKHELRFRFVSGYDDAKELVFVKGPIIGRAKELSIPDWKIDDTRFSVKPIHISSVVRGIQGFEYFLIASRHRSFYIWQVIIPLVVIVMMSWTTFWIHPSEIGSQIGLSATSMLTVIAYRFALSGSIPKLSYTTRLDLFLTGSLILVFLALVEVVFSSHLYKNDDLKAGLRADKVSRIIFPIAFTLILIFAFVI